MRLSAIIPVHDGGDGLRRCLEALAASSRPPDEVIVVDDGSTDGSAEVASACGARVIRLAGTARGPAAARNQGALVAECDVLVFVDADVVVHQDTLAKLERCLADNPQAAAAFGSYDDRPAAPGLISRYRNLLHHYVHQHGRRAASTFWAGCGAIRRDVFLAVGGYAAAYARPAIEDIELGSRLWRAGHGIRLCPEAQATHLKRWTLASMLRTDIVDRALPWSRLIVRSGSLPDDLNVGKASRASAIAAWAMLLFLGAALWRPWLAVGAVGSAAALVLLNADLYRLFARRGGVGFAAGAAALHALYLLYSSLAFAAVAVPALLGRYGLVLLIAVTLAKGWVWSVAVPPWHGNDETDHFLYAQHIERFGNWYPAPGDWMPGEMRLARDLAQLRDVQGQARTLDLSDRAGIAAAMARLDDPAVKRDYAWDAKRTSVPDLTKFQPPLHYALLAAIQAPLERTSILVRLLASRWLSVLLGAATVGLAYAAGRLLWPERPGWSLAMATMVSFQPMFTYCTAIANNQALEIALFSAVTVVMLQVARRGLTWRRAAALGALTGVGLLTRITFVGALALLGLTLAWEAARLWRSGGWRRQVLGSWAMALLVPALLGGWWYRDVLFSRGAAWVGRFGTPSAGRSLSALAYLWQRDLVGLADAILGGYWANFGQLDTPFPGGITTLLKWVTCIGAWGAGWWLLRRLLSRKKDGQASALLLALAPTAVLSAFYLYLDYRLMRDLGGHFGIQARYFLPGLIGQMAALLIGLSWPAPARWRGAWAWLVAMGAVAVGLFGLFGVLGPRYYGADGPRSLAALASVLQPVGPTFLLAGILVFLALTAVLGVALWGTLVGEAT